MQNFILIWNNIVRVDLDAKHWNESSGGALCGGADGPRPCAGRSAMGTGAPHSLHAFGQSSLEAELFLMAQGLLLREEP
jgi:hypothetical protein